MRLLNKLLMFSGKRDLAPAIWRTIQLLENSEDSDWSSLSAKEIKQVLEKELVNLRNNLKFDKLELAILYAPTGNVQETAMRNGWHKEYLEITGIVDKYI